LLSEKAGINSLPFFFDPRSCILATESKMQDSCLGAGKIKALKMLDLQKKYAIISNILQVQHQARNLEFLLFL